MQVHVSPETQPVTVLTGPSQSPDGIKTRLSKKKKSQETNIYLRKAQYLCNLRTSQEHSKVDTSNFNVDSCLSVFLTMQILFNFCYLLNRRGYPGKIHVFNYTCSNFFLFSHYG